MLVVEDDEVAVDVLPDRQVVEVERELLHLGLAARARDVHGAGPLLAVGMPAALDRKNAACVNGDAAAFRFLRNLPLALQGVVIVLGSLVTADSRQVGAQDGYVLVAEYGTHGAALHDLFDLRVDFLLVRRHVDELSILVVEEVAYGSVELFHL